MEEKPQVKIIYKKSLMQKLVMLGHDLLYTTRNKHNRKFQCFMFTWSPELERDLAELTGHEYVEGSHGE